MRRVGVLMGLSSNDVQQRVERLGWMEGRNIGIHHRWGASDPDRMWASAKELVELQPDVIVAH
jgi:hypothetical protein